MGQGNASTRNPDAVRFGLMVELRTIAGDIEQRFGVAEAGDLSGRLNRATDQLDDLVKNLLFGEADEP